MVIDFAHEAAKRRDRRPQLAGDTVGNVHTLRKPGAGESLPPFAVAECGSGWYHDTEIARVPTITSHRDWD